MNAATVAAQVVALAAVLGLGVAVIHKLHLLLGRRAQEMPSLQFGSRTGRWATPALAGAAIFEVALICTVLLLPTVGLGAVSATMIAYAALLSRLNPDETCGCFGDLLPMENRIGVWRNVLLALATAGAASVGAIHNLNHHLVTQLTGGITLIVLAIAISIAQTLRLRTSSMTRLSLGPHTGATDAD